MSASNQLRDRYLRLLQPPVDIGAEVGTQLSPPLLVSPGDAWNKARYRLMLVGQETFGWDYRDPAARQTDAEIGWISYLSQCQANDSHLASLFDLYETFDLAENTPSARTPFWQAHRQLASSLENGNHRAVLWSNLARACSFNVNSGNASPIHNLEASDLQKFIAWQAGVLAQEMRTFEVGAVIFFTGPYYDELIESEFPGARFQPIPEFQQFNKRQLARVEHDGLPRHSYRTYHPSYLRRSGRWGVVDTLAQLISGGRISAATSV